VSPLLAIVLGLGPLVAFVPHAALALEEVIQQATQEHKTVFIVGLTYPVARLMGRMGCLDRVREAERFENRPDAVRAAVALLRNQ
jgi:hypothetical protein